MVCKVEVLIKGRQRHRQERFKRTRWWKLNEEEHREKLVKAMKEELVQEAWSWEETSMKMRVVAKEVLGVTSGRAGKKEETWWWNTEVQEAVTEKREKKSERDLSRCEETIRNYKQANKKAVAKAKCKACDDLYTSLEEKDGQLKAMRIAKHKNQEFQDMCQAKQMKNDVGQVLLDDEDIKDRWRFLNSL